MSKRQPVGKYHIQFCRMTICIICGDGELQQRPLEYLNIPLHGVTADGLFSAGESECLGTCMNAPMFVVNDSSNLPNYRYDYVKDATWQKVKDIIEDLREGRPPNVGPQQPDRQYAEPAGSRPSFFFKGPPLPYCRDLDAKKQKQKKEAPKK